MVVIQSYSLFKTPPVVFLLRRQSPSDVQSVNFPYGDNCEKYGNAVMGTNLNTALKMMK